MSTAASSEEDVCAGGCGKTDDLQRCSKCKSIKYCSKECQKKGWKLHKKICPLLAQINATRDASDSSSNAGPSAASASRSSASDTTPRLKNLETHIEKPFHKLDNKTWLHGRSEKDTFQLLIDSFRLRLDDEYTFEGDAEMDTIYDGESADSRKAFKRYLRKAERKTGYLPDWWNEEKSKACIRFGLRKSEWSYLGAAVEKSDITEHYGSSLMPMQLRMFAEEVIGEPLRGMGGGASMRAMQMMAEGGLGGTGGLNMSTLSFR